MKIKKNSENVKPEQENEALNDEMQELDEDIANQFSGGTGNPFAKAARVSLQEITEDVRNRV